jgi:hypothetical protein
VLAQAAGDGSLLVLIPVAIGIALVGSLLYDHRRKRRKREALGRLVHRDPSLMLTVTPGGWDADAMALAFSSCPRGDRHRGIRYGVEGRVDLEVDGREHRPTCAAFQWFWEERRTQRTGSGPGASTRSRYEERKATIAMIELPVPVLRKVVIEPENVLGRVGVTRGGVLVESDAFNRRFRVECRERNLAVQLLDAGMQELLINAFAGRTIELHQGVLLLRGSPSHRDDSLTGIVGELPAVRQDVQRLLRAIPPQFWRAVAAAG